MHWIDKICNDFGISINTLARRSGISPGALGNSKARGTTLSNTSYGNVVKIARALGLDPETLLIRYG